MQNEPSGSEARPVIGVCGVPTVATWGFWTQPAVLAAQTYLDCVLQAGGLPMVLTPAPADAVPQILRALDGVVLAGGTDIGPEHYGQAPGPLLEEVEASRDTFEREIAAGALAADLPVLGICRGLQVLNVAAGGTLHQDLGHEGFAEHRPAPGRLDDVTNHAVRVDPDSRLGRCGLADLHAVNSHHHQGVAELGHGARVVARSVPDDCVEALEWPDRQFALGVQWHPESPAMPELFAALIDAARRTSLRLNVA